jgi:hypothetical protein
MAYAHASLWRSDAQPIVRVSCTEMSWLTDFLTCRITNRNGWVSSGLVASTLFSGRRTAESREITVEGDGEW